MARAPIYAEIKRSILDEIDQGVFPEGGRLTPEVELAERFGVSRPTVRQAILELAREGVVARKRGHGTVVLRRRHEPGTRTSGRSEEASSLTAVAAALLAAIDRSSRQTLDQAADAMLATIQRDGLIHVAGTGHGLILVLEAFYRPGGLACINPIWDPALLPLNGARRSTTLERTGGMGTSLADRARIRPGDCLFVFSQSGVNPVPVELAVRARELGATAIAVTSVGHSSSVPSRVPDGRRLLDVAEIVIDTHVPPGDAAFLPAGRPPAVAALSTIAGTHVWNLLLVRLVKRARAKGHELPIWISSNVAGGDERVRALVEAYGARVPSL